LPAAAALRSVPEGGEAAAATPPRAAERAILLTFLQTRILPHTILQHRFTHCTAQHPTSAFCCLSLCSMLLLPFVCSAFCYWCAFLLYAFFVAARRKACLFMPLVYVSLRWASYGLVDVGACGLDVVCSVAVCCGGLYLLYVVPWTSL